MFIDRCMDNENVVYVYNEILLNSKKKKILLSATTWINLEDIIVNKLSQK